MQSGLDEWEYGKIIWKVWINRCLVLWGESNISEGYKKGMTTEQHNVYFFSDTSEKNYGQEKSDSIFSQVNFF